MITQSTSAIAAFSESRAVSIQRFIEVERAEPGRLTLGADLALEVGLDVGQEQHVRVARVLRELRLELAEHVQLGVVCVGGVEVVVVMPCQKKVLPSGDSLDVLGDHASPLERRELIRAEIVAHRPHYPNLGEEAGREREVHGGAAEHALALSERRAHGVEGD